MKIHTKLKFETIISRANKSGYGPYKHDGSSIYKSSEEDTWIRCGTFNDSRMFKEEFMLNELGICEDELGTYVVY